MRALQLQETTGPDALELTEVDEPAPEDGHVVIDVEAAGVSFPDLLLTRGEYQLKPEAPFIPGVEAAGTVRSAPADSDLAEGDRVMGLGMLGGWAQQMKVPVQMCFRVPEGLDSGQAAGMVMNYHTAHFALERRGRLSEGETLLVHGAAGGVGSAAIQVAKGLGARVIAVVSSDEKAETASAAGADETVRSDADWVAETKDLTGGGVHCIFDPVGGERLVASPRCLRPEGRLLVVGFAEGSIPELAANRILLRNIDVCGVNWGGFLPSDPGLPAHTHEQLSAMVEAGHVRPLVGERYPLGEAARALSDLDSRRAQGKLILEI